MTRISVIGMYNYNPDIFSSLDLPPGVDRNTLQTEILSEASDLEMLYGDPDVFAILLHNWGKTMLPVWTRIYKAVTKEYDPLYNYDRTETHNEISSATGTSNNSNLDQVAGYNSSALENSGQQTGSESTSGKNETTYEHRAYGNIGVTTSQQMLQAELDIAHNTNIYNIIADDFIKKFCIMVY